MFTDPLVLYTGAPTGATSAVAFSGAGNTSNSFVATGRGPTQSTYRRTFSTTHYIDLTIGRQNGKRNRFTVRLTETELVPDPIDSSVNSLKSSSVYVVADIGVLGQSSGFEGMLHSLAYFLYDSTDAAPLMDRVLAGET